MTTVAPACALLDNAAYLVGSSCRTTEVNVLGQWSCPPNTSKTSEGDCAYNEFSTPCPAYSTRDSSTQTCVCDSGFVPNKYNNACVRPDDPDAIYTPSSGDSQADADTQAFGSLTPSSTLAPSTSSASMMVLAGFALIGFYFFTSKV